VPDKVSLTTRPGRRAFRRFQYTLEWMQMAAILLLILYLGVLALV
jgi:hypothetical protein